jgi:hypothetical protein
VSPRPLPANERALAIVGLIALLALMFLVALAPTQPDATTLHRQDCVRRFASDLSAADSLGTVIRHRCLPEVAP